MSTESPETEARVEAGTVPKTQFPFALLLTAVAVFPIAFGLGKARIKRTAAKQNVHVVSDQHGNSSTRKALPPRIQPADRQRGDVWLKGGRFEAALHYYQSLGSTDHLRLPPELQYRIAVCQEGLGLWEEALVLNENITATCVAEPLFSSALLAQARIQLRQNRPDRAVTLLKLISVQPHAVERAKQEAEFLIPLAMASQLIAESETNVQHPDDERNDLTPINDVFDWPLTTVLDDIALHETTHHPTGTNDTTESHAEVGLQSEVTHSDLAGEFNHHLIADAERPANLYEGPEAVTRMLEAVINASPGNRFVQHARFALGRMAQANGDQELAASYYVPLVGRAATPVAIRAAFNAAVCHYRLNDLSRACEMLEQVVHGAPGHDVHARSLILYGRLLLDRGDYRQAAFQLQRASGTRMPPQTQALASVYLGMAHLMRGNPRDATESLFADKPHLIDGPVKNASAFVTSLARFRLLNGTMQEREATFLYRALVAIEEDAEWLGPTGQLLIGQALLSLGLRDKMFEHYQKALDKNILPVGIAHEMRFAMAENLLRERKPQDAELLLLDLSLNGEGAIQAKSRMRLAEIALNNNRPEDCLSACRDLFATTSPDKQALLRLAGRAYEQLGQNALAAECYRGRLPPP